MFNLMASHLQAHVRAACAHVKHGDRGLRDGSGPGCIRHAYVSHGVHVSGGCQCVMLSHCRKKSAPERLQCFASRNEKRRCLFKSTQFEKFGYSSLNGAYSAVRTLFFLQMR